MSPLPRITIVTPNLNGERFLEETLNSVISQDYPNLEYIVVDGGSQDGSLNIIQKYRKFISLLIIEKDNGLYSALQKGFRNSTGWIMGWINSDDVLQTKSLFALSDIFSINTSIHWLQGYPTVIDEIGRIVYSRSHIWSKFFFFLNLYKGGSFIQQESTFWTRELWDKSGAFISDRYKYAGDFELWMRFFRFEQMYLTKTMLGSFRIRSEGQLSREHYTHYLEECDMVIREYLSNESEKELQVLNDLRCMKPPIASHSALESFLGKPPTVDFSFKTHHYEIQ